LNELEVRFLIRASTLIHQAKPPQEIVKDLLQQLRHQSSAHTYRLFLLLMSRLPMARSKFSIRKQRRGEIMSTHENRVKLTGTIGRRGSVAKRL
jgi:hypothetical protein